MSTSSPTTASPSSAAPTETRAKARWRKLRRDVMTSVKFMSLARPDFPVEQLQPMKTFFTAANKNTPPTCSRSNFVIAIGSVTNGKYPARQILKWFDEMDVHRTGFLHWESFTNAVIHEAGGEILTDWRAIEFVENVRVRKSFEHKASVSRVIVSGHEGCIFTAAGDGVVAQWDSVGEVAKRFVQNGETKTVVNSQNTCAIVDVVVGGRGPCVYVCAANKTIAAYSYENLDVRRKFVMREKYNELALEPRERLFNRANMLVDTVVLMGVKDAPSCIDVVMIDRVETLFLGVVNGEVLVYAFGNPNALEIHPQRVLKLHSAPVERICISREFGSLISCGWDGIICFADMNNGYRVTSRLTSAAESVQAQTRYGKRAVVEFALFPKMKVICSVSREREAFVWNPAIDNPVARLSHPSIAKAITANDADCQLITLSDDNYVRVFDLRTYAVLQILAPDTDIPVRLHAITYHAATSTLVVTSNRPYSWSMRRKGVKFETTGGHVEPVTHVLCAERLVVTADAHTVIVWLASCGKKVCVWVPFEHPQTLVGIASDCHRRRLIAFGSFGSIAIYSISNGLRIAVTSFPQSVIASSGMRFMAEATMSPTGPERYLVVTNDRQLVIMREHDVASEDVARITLMPSRISSAVIIPSGLNICQSAAVVTSQDSGAIIVTNLATQLQVWYAEVLDTAESLLWCPITKLLWFVSRHAVKRLEVGAKLPVVASTSASETLEVTACAVCEDTLLVGDQTGSLLVLKQIEARIVVAQEVNYAVESAVTFLERCGNGLLAVGALTGSVSVFSSTFVMLGRLGQTTLWSTFALGPPPVKPQRVVADGLDMADLTKSLAPPPPAVKTLGDTLRSIDSSTFTLSSSRMGRILSLSSDTNRVSLPPMERPPTVSFADSKLRQSDAPQQQRRNSRREPTPLLPETLRPLTRQSVFPPLGSSPDFLRSRTCTPAVGIRPISRAGIVKQKSDPSTLTFVTESALDLDRSNQELIPTEPPLVTTPTCGSSRAGSRAGRRTRSPPQNELARSTPLPAIKTVGEQMMSLYDYFFEGASRASPMSLKKSQGLDWVSRVSSLIPLSESQATYVPDVVAEGRNKQRGGGSPSRGGRSPPASPRQ